MKEEEFLSVIKSVIGDKYIGDDCAYLKDLGLVVSQDSLVEDVHFKRSYITPFQLGYKSAMVNISDIAASGGGSKYITVALSLPKDITSDFVKEFYQGFNSALSECGDIEIIGGDITGADKIMISVTIIGIDKNRRISSRAGAHSGQVVVTSGTHGSSSGGLKLLLNGEMNQKLVDSHLHPVAQVEFAKNISENIKEDYAMMDSSDGLADALIKIAQASEKTLIVDFDKVKYDNELKECFPSDYKDLILYGGEDYQIVATIPEKLAAELNITDCIIGYVTDKQEYPVCIRNYDGEEIYLNPENCFNHFS